MYFQSFVDKLQLMSYSQSNSLDSLGLPLHYNSELNSCEGNHMTFKAYCIASLSSDRKIAGLCFKELETKEGIKTII